ncbi:hypothetical protein [Streptomyces hebeiensis]
MDIVPSHVKQRMSKEDQLSVLQEELNSAMAISNKVKTTIIDELKKLYKDKGIYKVTSEILLSHFKKYPGLASEQYLRQQISVLKTEGILQDLGEVITGSNGRKLKYFALTEILEEVTSPKKEIEVSKTVPNQASPITVASNPFDKVNSQLGELLSKVNGLSNGYAELVQNKQNLDDVEHMVSALRSDLFTATTAIQEHISSMIKNVNGSEDYKRGIQDGLKMAIEMNITSRHDGSSTT